MRKYTVQRIVRSTFQRFREVLAGGVNEHSGECLLSNNNARNRLAYRLGGVCSGCRPASVSSVPVSESQESITRTIAARVEMSGHVCHFPCGQALSREWRSHIVRFSDTPATT